MNKPKFIEISGHGQTKFGELYEYSLEDLIFEATNLALDNAKLTIGEIDTIYIGNMTGGEVSNQSHLGAVFSELYNFKGPVMRIEGACASGALAIHSAMQSLQASNAKTALVVGCEKMTDFESNRIGSLLMQAASQEEREAGLSFPGLYALMTNSYIEKYGLERDDLSKAPYLMHKNALTNQYAQFKKEFTIEQISNSTLIADPLRLLDCSPISDGAAAVVLTARNELNPNKAYLVDIQVSCDNAGLAGRDNQYSIAATQRAAKKIYDRNEVSAGQISVIELHDCFSIAMFMALEDLGFANPGESLSLIDDIISKKSNLTLNPSGGLKACGHPVGATGVKQLIEVAKQIEGTSALSLGLTHNVGGSGGTSVVGLVANKEYFS
jgi:acetyl-CoA C-acetyltransferase